MQNGVSKKDWALFREKVPGWQEAYMDRLGREYVELLTGPEAPSEKFWKLEKRIKQDKRNPGVQIEMRRSAFEMNLLSLLTHDVIRLEDLSEFSEEVQEKMAEILKCFRRDFSESEDE